MTYIFITIHSNINFFLFPHFLYLCWLYYSEWYNLTCKIINTSFEIQINRAGPWNLVGVWCSLMTHTTPTIPFNTPSPSEQSKFFKTSAHYTFSPDGLSWFWSVDLDKFNLSCSKTNRAIKKASPGEIKHYLHWKSWKSSWVLPSPDSSL